MCVSQFASGPLQGLVATALKLEDIIFSFCLASCVFTFTVYSCIHAFKVAYKKGKKAK